MNGPVPDATPLPEQPTPASAPPPPPAPSAASRSSPPLPGPSSPASAPPPLPPLRLRAAAALPGALLALLLGLSTLNHEFVQDDHFVIVDNPQVRSLASLPEIFATPYTHYAGLNRPASDHRPMPIATFALEWQLAGPRPLLYHLDNALLHALVTFLVSLLAWRIAREPSAALWTGLVFAVMPVHCDNVGSVTERSSILALLFGLGFLLSHGRPGAPARIASPLLLGFALLSKEAAVAFPFLALLLDVRELGRPALAPAALLRRYLPVALVCAGWWLLRLWVVGTATYVTSVSYFARTPWTAIAPTMGRFFFSGYLLPVVLGYHVCSDYSFASFPTSAPGDLLGWSALAATVAAAIAAAAVFFRRRSPWSLGALWFLITLLPVSNLIVRLQILGGERLLYVPSVGAALALGAFVAAATAPGRAAAVRAAAQAIAGIYLAFCALQFLVGLAGWHDERVFYDRVLEACPDNVLARVGRSRLGVAPEEMPGAVADAEHAVRVAPQAAEMRYTLGWALLRSGFPEAASFAARQGIALDAPTLHKGHHLLGQCHEALARMAEALAAYRQAISQSPRWPPPHRAAATLLLAAGDAARALDAVRAARGLDPADVWTAALEVRILAVAGRAPDARAVADAPPLADPTSPPGRVASAALELGAGRAERAEAILVPLLAESPHIPLAHALLSEVHARSGDARGAGAEWVRALPGGASLARLAALPDAERWSLAATELKRVRSLTLGVPELQAIEHEIDQALRRERRR